VLGSGNDRYNFEDALVEEKRAIVYLCAEI
jgi:hypothetical protein